MPSFIEGHVGLLESVHSFIMFLLIGLKGHKPALAV